MAATSVITTRLDPETMALVDKVAKAQGRSRAWFAARAIKQVAEAEAEFEAFIKEGDDAFERGDFVDGDVVLKILDGWIAEFEAKAG